MKLTLSIVLLGVIAAPALVHGSSDVKEDNTNAKFFLKSYQTTTVTTLSIILTTVPYFCAVTSTSTGAGAPTLMACTGRNLMRKRRLSFRGIEKPKTVQLQDSTETSRSWRGRRRSWRRERRGSSSPCGRARPPLSPFGGSIRMSSRENMHYEECTRYIAKLTLSIILLGLIAAPALVHGSSEVKEEGANAKFFLKSYQTTTVTTLSVVLTTVPYFCAVTSTPAAGPPLGACTGRNLRRKRRVSIREMDPEKSVQLEESTEDVPQAVKEEEDGNERLFFTLWQSTTTTVTVTSTRTNTSITISASAFCTFANYNVPLC
ncbi:uncharacterized protein LOC135203992 [Macrobrachium nipponense]|uniref:uncharacterized protein LOC135203992 n=1 Tax=Macrobrachium nipponense TaxID=159736 RepID=UPI0030C89A9E